MMVELIEKRVTRSLSNELQNRGQGHHPVHSQNIAQPAHPLGLQCKSQLLDNGDGCNGLHPKVGHPGNFAFEQPRSTTEEIFIRTLVDGSITQSSPTMDGLGFANLPPMYKKESEELFNAWLNMDGHGEISSSQCAWQQARGPYDKSMDISQELRGSGQQVDGGQQYNLTSSSLCPQSPPMENGTNGARFSLTPDVANMQTFSWFQNGRPMTRSRSAELRQKYAVMQGLSSLPPSLQAAHNSITRGTHGASPALARGGGGGYLTYNESQPLDASSANIPVPSISNMVSILKESLECRRSPQLKHRHHGASAQAELLGQLGRLDPEEEARDQSQMGHGAIQSPKAASIGEATPRVSSGGALTLSARMKNVPPSYSATPISMSQNSLKQTSHSPGMVEQLLEKISHGGIKRSPHVSSGGEGSLKGFPSIGKNPQQLTRVGSLISSAGSGIATDSMSPTKMRRVERREKMLESKGRPVVPSDLQIALKRCDALEKEVRSLKLNLSFMNRKDSEQTKRIEELEKENLELQKEKERLLDEVQRLTSCDPYY